MLERSMEYVIIMMVLLHKADAFVVYGSYGDTYQKTTFAVKDKVHWKKAADQCNIFSNRVGRLLTRPSPELITQILLHHRYILQQNGWPHYEHLWTSFVSDESGSWKKSLIDGHCEQLSDEFDGYFPRQTTGHARCALLNMAGTGLGDLWIFRPCSEPHGYLCRPNNYLDFGFLEITIYDESAINLSFIIDVPKIMTIENMNFELCKKELESERPAFAAVYSNMLSICTLYFSQTFRYPVPIDIVSDKSVTTLVKSNAQNVTIIDSLNVTVEYSSFGDCYNDSFDYTPDVTSSPPTSPRSPVPITTTHKEVLTSAHQENQETSPKPNDVTDPTDANQHCIPLCQEKCAKNKSSLLTDSFGLISTKLNKKLLSSYKRSLSSAPDDRTSSFVIGLSGTAVLILAILLIIVPDVVNFVGNLRQRKHATNIIRNQGNL